MFYYHDYSSLCVVYHVSMSTFFQFYIGTKTDCLQNLEHYMSNVVLVLPLSNIDRLEQLIFV